MSYAGMNFVNDHILMEEEYSLLHEENVAALLTTGNGYMGVRASLEEYSSLGIQGFLVRGVMDEVVEVRLTKCDNEYMKKYYVEEERLKKFEKQERAINLLDFLLLRFEINGEVFYPWEGKVLSWRRWLDVSDETLHREVIWENTQGQQSRLTFERFASFADDHIYCMRASIEPLNYSGTLKIYSGMDLRVKSNGQMPQKRIDAGFGKSSLWQEEVVGPKYGFHAICGISNHFSEKSAEWENIDEDGLLMQAVTFEAKQNRVYTVEKLISTVTSRDFEEGKVLFGGEFLKKGDSLKMCIDRYLGSFESDSYEKEYERHVKNFRELFSKIDIKISGDDKADRAVRFSCYHTLISLVRNDYVHSFSAKGLTGETYNDFVWWDAEIYQAPVFQQTIPEYAKNNILFRYSHLDEARELAKKEGCAGARFPFTTGVTGDETIWIDVRHPFMQIHCVSDVALSVLNYYVSTGDDDFIKTYGMEILMEVCRYWVSRVTWNSDKERYEILKVTGTDEHHPYVDNNAYTNYSVYHVLHETLQLMEKYGPGLNELKARIGFEEKEKDRFAEVAKKIYLPLDEKTGMIPQFDGYFDLSKDLEVEGGSNAGYTQMKQAGLYNKSQVIKQPDVLMLFAYQNLPVSDRVYQRNLDYYLERCEASSSLSYCVHSICCADRDMPESAYTYLLNTAELDLLDLHGGAAEGVHASCATGAWMAATRGICGMKMTQEGVTFDPHFIPWWKEASFHAVWHGLGYTVRVSNEALIISADEGNAGTLPIRAKGESFPLEPGKTQKIKEQKDRNPVR